MKTRWLIGFASVPLVAAIVVLQSCGGVGGPTSSGTAGGNVPTAAFLALLSPEQKASQFIGANACAAPTCHGGNVTSAHVTAQLANGHMTAQLASAKRTTGSTTTPPTEYDEWKLTMHYQKGVSCENCHGPGGAHQKNPTKTNILTFPGLTSPVVCAQCHGPIHDDYSASLHNQVLLDPVNAAATSQTSSRCIACHGGLSRTQYQENGTDIGTLTTAQITGLQSDIANVVPQTATCVTCHDPHAVTGNLVAGQEVQLIHPSSSMDTSKIVGGNTAATFTNFDHACAECHNGRGMNGSDAAITASTSRPAAHYSSQFNMLLGVGGAETQGGPPVRVGTHASAPDQCIHCHMPSARHTFTVGYDGCAPCHSVADATSRVTTFQANMLSNLVGLRTAMQNWSKVALGDPDLWDYTSNITALGKTAPAQTKIPIEVKRARHNYYFIVQGGDLGVHNPGYSNYLVTVGKSGLSSLGYPAPAVNMNTAQLKQIVKTDVANSQKADLINP